MDYGIVLPHFGSFAREDATQRVMTAAEAAEALGFSTVWVVDHVVFPEKLEGYAFNPLDPFLEPMTVLGALALKTKRVKLGTAVLVLPYRHPLYTAKALATVDVPVWWAIGCWCRCWLARRRVQCLWRADR